MGQLGRHGHGWGQDQQTVRNPVGQDQPPVARGRAGQQRVAVDAVVGVTLRQWHGQRVAQVGTGWQIFADEVAHIRHWQSLLEEGRAATQVVKPRLAGLEPGLGAAEGRANVGVQGDARRFVEGLVTPHMQHELVHAVGEMVVSKRFEAERILGPADAEGGEGLGTDDAFAVDVAAANRVTNVVRLVKIERRTPELPHGHIRVLIELQTIGYHGGRKALTTDATTLIPPELLHGFVKIIAH